MTVSRVLVLAAVLVFVLAVFGVAPFGLNPIPFGLALWASSQLV